MMVPKTNLDPPITRDYFVRDGRDRMLKKTVWEWLEQRSFYSGCVLAKTTQGAFELDL